MALHGLKRSSPDIDLEEERKNYEGCHNDRVDNSKQEL
jgi:hypothetical protein